MSEIPTSSSASTKTSGFCPLPPAPMQPKAKRFDMEDISNALNLGLIVVDAEGKVLLWNNWIAKYSNIKEADVLNRPLELDWSEPASPAF